MHALLPFQSPCSEKGNAVVEMTATSPFAKVILITIEYFVNQLNALKTLHREFGCLSETSINSGSSNPLTREFD